MFGAFGGSSTIYLLRHGETEWNLRGRRQGRLDSPLTTRGLGQARASGRLLRDHLAACRLTLFASSPMGRARKTAAIVAEELELDDASVRTDPLLAEHDMGAWAGLTNEEVDARFGDARKQRERDRWHYRIPAGESYERLDLRAREWLASVEREPLVVAVGHEMINRTLLGAYAGLSHEETLALSHSHEIVYRLSGGAFEPLR